jgi:hypothetical protein
VSEVTTASLVGRRSVGLYADGADPDRVLRFGCRSVQASDATREPPLDLE